MLQSIPHHECPITVDFEAAAETECRVDKPGYGGIRGKTLLPKLSTDGVVVVNIPLTYTESVTLVVHQRYIPLKAGSTLPSLLLSSLHLR